MITSTRDRQIVTARCAASKNSEHCDDKSGGSILNLIQIKDSNLNA